MLAKIVADHRESRSLWRHTLNGLLLSVLEQVEVFNGQAANCEAIEDFSTALMAFQLGSFQAGIELVVQYDYGNQNLIGLDANGILSAKGRGHSSEMEQGHEDEE